MQLNNKPVRLLRVAIAAIFAELIPLVVLVALITIYGYTAVPGQNKEAYESFAQEAGKYTGPIVGALATLGMSFWAARNQTNAWLLHGTLTGFLVMFLDLAIYLSQESATELPFILGLPAKLLAGLLGGYLAQRRYQNLPPKAREGHRLI